MRCRMREEEKIGYVGTGKRDEDERTGRRNQFKRQAFAGRASTTGDAIQANAFKLKVIERFFLAPSEVYFRER